MASLYHFIYVPASNLANPTSVHVIYSAGHEACLVRKQEGGYANDLQRICLAFLNLGADLVRVLDRVIGHHRSVSATCVRRLVRPACDGTWTKLVLTRSDAVDADSHVFFRCTTSQTNDGMLAGAIGRKGRPADLALGAGGGHLPTILAKNNQVQRVLGTGGWDC